MKKIILFLIGMIVPYIVSASSINYDITDFLIDAQIQKDGSMNVKELIVLDGNFNGYIRELQYKNSKLKEYTPGDINFSNSAIYNASGITNVTTASKKMVDEELDFSLFEENFVPFTKVANESLAKEGDVFYRKNDDLLSYKMYRSANDESVGFLISYTIEDAVVLHEDIAELYWNFIGAGFTDKIYNLKIRVSLPEELEQNNMRFWAHGDITGEIDALDNHTILATMKSLEKNSVVDIRMIFNKNIITNSKNLRHSQQVALDSILEIENKRAEDANKQRELIRFIRQGIIIITNIYYLIVLALWIWVYWKFDKEYKSNFHAKYYREFTGAYNVEVIDYLMNKNISPNAMSASIMNLIYKKNIEVEEAANENTKRKKYIFHLKNNHNVSNTEQVLLDFLFERVGKENTFTTSDLEKYAKSPKTCEKFTKNYNDWKNCVIKDAEQEKFYETNGIPVVIGILLLLFTILIFLVVMYYQIDYFPSYFLLPIGIIFLLYSITIKKRTKSGNEDYLRWKAFKNFLNDFGNFKVKELPEIILWEKYLVYATVFGLADQVEKSMNVKIKEYEQLGNIQDIYTYDPFYHFHLHHVINESISRSVRSSIVASSANANSRNSSGSGFGGGFSSGSGFGGGGGGGHGF